MGSAAKKPCKKLGCAALVGSEQGFCEKHAGLSRKPWASVTTSRQSRGYGRQWELNSKMIIRRDPFCMIAKVCVERTGRPAPSTCTDHIIAKANGGTDHDDNLQGACRDCNEWKARTIDKKAVGSTE
jgi:5-methylcytosine-specific restriction protein A